MLEVITVEGAQGTSFEGGHGILQGARAETRFGARARAEAAAEAAAA